MHLKHLREDLERVGDELCLDVRYNVESSIERLTINVLLDDHGERSEKTLFERR